MRKILLNSARGQENVNVVNSVDIDLTTKQRLFTGGDSTGTINHYEMYLKERNDCDRYKLFFTINPYMSNILFNMFTEVVYDENMGGWATILGDTPLQKTGNANWERGHRTYSKDDKGVFDSGITRYEAIRDTEYSHPELGNFTYHPGLDIFNNHYLRSEGYFAIRKGKHSGGDNKSVFNTISDYLVYDNGSIATHKREVPIESDPTKTVDKNTHIFGRTNFSTFSNAFATRLKEENGWLGFYNKSYAKGANHTIIVDGVEKDIEINRVLNNRNACEFIDMYPDRSLFSLLPKINKNYKNREEYNWEWCITYPYKKRYTKDNGGVYDFFEKGKGLRIIWNSSDVLYMNNINANLLEPNFVTRESRAVYFRTKAKHGLSVGDIVRLTDGEDRSFSCPVVGVGDTNKEMKKYYFSVSYDDLADGWGEESKYVIMGRVEGVKIPNKVYVAKVINGVPCDYYIREFKVIEELHSTINKAGFARTIYNDPVAQIIFSDDLNVSGLKDHLGRSLTEVYLTIVKKNRGYSNWYTYGTTNPAVVEASHCFGKVTSGFDFEMGGKDIVTEEFMEIMKDYNVRMAYNVIGGGINTYDMKIPYSSGDTLEEEVSLKYPYGLTLFGDFVEFSPSDVRENVLEDVHHRFNTAQRETNLGKDSKFPSNFDALCYDEILYDDYDWADGLTDRATESTIVDFEIEKRKGLRSGEGVRQGDNYQYHDNFFPEGYFYKPHHRVKLKEFSDIVSKDYDMELPIITENGVKIKDCGLFLYEMTSAKDYSLTTSDVLVLLYENNVYQEVVVAPGTKGTRIVFSGTIPIDMCPKRVFVKNPLVPDYAYYPADGTGRRVWRELIPDTELNQTSDIYNRPFSNGAIYINTNINLYLRRQDPDGRYGMQYTYQRVGDFSNYVLTGLEKSLPDVDYKIQTDYTTCEL